MFDFLHICVCYSLLMSNFLFLKKNNENLFNIISEAENLFRDEYFEQSIVQVRRFAENLCRDLLQEKALSDDTFDSMINKIKDNSFNNIRMKELAEDLYYLKKHGNNSAHSANASQNGKLALECLERAYEITIFYSNIKYGYNKSLDKTVFSEELLMTGKKSSSKVLKEKYTNELKRTRDKSRENKQNKKLKTKIESTSKNKVKISKSKNKGRKKVPKTFISLMIFIILILLGHFFL